MSRGQYQAKVQRPTQDGPESAEPRCDTCPFWTRQGSTEKGICHGSGGPLMLHAGQGLFAATLADDWCRLHPRAPK